MEMNTFFDTKGAYFSDDKMYRYSLYRWWNRLYPQIMFIGLNPSTADEFNDDPTIKRCISFAKKWGCGGLLMMNLFAFRATEPKVMKISENPIGSENNYWLKQMSKKACTVVAAWGNHGSLRNRDKEIIEMIPDLYCLGLTKQGQPKHPLFLNKDTELIKYKGGI